MTANWRGDLIDLCFLKYPNWERKLVPSQRMSSSCARRFEDHRLTRFLTPLTNYWALLCGVRRSHNVVLSYHHRVKSNVVESRKLTPCEIFYNSPNPRFSYYISIQRTKGRRTGNLPCVASRTVRIFRHADI